MFPLKIKLYLKLFRVSHWIKNLLIFAPVFFSLDLSREKIILSFFTFIAFSLAASSIYIVNDIIDLEKDRLHPEKKYRPLASGAISIKEAMFLHLVLLSLASILAVLLNIEVFIVILFYVILNFFYSLILKNKPLMDVLSIGLSFMLRLIAGSYATGIELSMWIILATFTLSMFIAFAKRLEDIDLYEEGMITRGVVKHYNKEFLVSAIYLTSFTSITFYIIYTIVEHRDTKLPYTIFFVILGFLRYFYLIFYRKLYGNPVSILLRDKFLQTVIILWLISYFLLIKKIK